MFEYSIWILGSVIFGNRLVDVHNDTIYNPGEYVFEDEDDIEYHQHIWSPTSLTKIDVTRRYYNQWESKKCLELKLWIPNKSVTLSLSIQKSINHWLPWFGNGRKATQLWKIIWQEGTKSDDEMVWIRDERTRLRTGAASTRELVRTWSCLKFSGVNKLESPNLRHIIYMIQGLYEQGLLSIHLTDNRSLRIIDQTIPTYLRSAFWLFFLLCRINFAE